MSEPKIKSWSFSRLQDWVECKLKACLKHGERIPDPNPAKAADRGTEIHDMAERFVRGEIKVMPLELAAFEPEFRALQRDYKSGNLELEGEWGIDRNWKSVPYKSAWGRIKLDLFHRMQRTRAAVVDYKTGKKDGNETKHGRQLQFYATTSFCRHSELEKIDGEVWYLDKNELTHMTFNRQTALALYLPYWNKLAVEMTEATLFPPTPNIISCKYCPYGEDDTYDKEARYGPTTGTGHCKVRLKPSAQDTRNFYARMHANKQR